MIKYWEESAMMNFNEPRYSLSRNYSIIDLFCKSVEIFAKFAVLKSSLNELAATMSCHDPYFETFFSA